MKVRVGLNRAEHESKRKKFTSPTMVQFFDHIPEFLSTWILEQKIFWVATAPLSGQGHVNLSPKGGQGTFHIIDEHTVWYEDLTGSGKQIVMDNQLANSFRTLLGVETISHIRENGRITVLFNAFEGPPRITRLWGTGITPTCQAGYNVTSRLTTSISGTVYEFDTPEYNALLQNNRRPGSRSVIMISVHKASTVSISFLGISRDAHVDNIFPVLRLRRPLLRLSRRTYEASRIRNQERNNR